MEVILQVAHHQVFRVAVAVLLIQLQAHPLIQVEVVLHTVAEVLVQAVAQAAVVEVVHQVVQVEVEEDNLTRQRKISVTNVNNLLI